MKRILLLFCLMSLATHQAAAEERFSSLTTQLGSTTIRGYVDSGISWLGQSDPGPASGGGVDRFYDDGFVRVDATGNPGGYTWFWSYENATQIQGSFIFFHSQTLLDANTIQLVTDTYDLGELFPPSAPYMGTFAGPGPVLPDAPFSRTIAIIPEPSFIALAAVAIGAAIVLRTRKTDGAKRVVAQDAGGPHGSNQAEDF